MQVHRQQQIDYLIIIVFDSSYKLKEFYKISWKECLPLITRGKKPEYDYINWSSLKNYGLDINTLGKQEIINLFK